MDKEKICHYIFDLYGTLVDIHTDEENEDVWERMSIWFRDNGADYDARVLRRGYQYEIKKQKEAVKVLCPMIKYPELRLESVFWNLFYSRGITPTEEAVAEAAWYFRRLSTEYIRLYPGALELLEMLKNQGKVWLLTNAQSVFTRRELDELGLARYFDGIFISSDYMCRKPDEHFFRALIEKEKIPAQSAVMIGNDGYCDIRGAVCAGISTIYLNSNLSPEFDGSEADIRIDPLDLQKLAAILRKE